MMGFVVKKGQRVYTADANSYGLATGSTHLCRLEGCRGLRVSVRWPDGGHTYPCSAGLVERGPHLQIWGS